ncbi:hypothetical protein WN943_015079 [Citrus x changshan-huyou]
MTKKPMGKISSLSKNGRLLFSLDLRGGGRSTSRECVRSQISCSRGCRGQIAARSRWTKGCVAVEKRLRCADLASR